MRTRPDPRRPQVLKHGAWLRVRAGQRITHNSDCHLRFYVLVEGLASLQNVYRGQLSEPRLQYSGCCWDLGVRARSAGASRGAGWCSRAVRRLAVLRQPSQPSR